MWFEKVEKSCEKKTKSHYGKIWKNKNYFFQIFIWDMVFLPMWVMCKNFINIGCDLRKLKKIVKKKLSPTTEKKKKNQNYFFPKLYLEYNFLTVVNIVSKFH